MCRKAELKAADAGERAGGGANFGREVGERADVVAEDGRGVRELGARQLHAVAAVAAEADDYGFQRFGFLPVQTLWGCRLGRGHQSFDSSESHALR